MNESRIGKTLAVCQPVQWWLPECPFPHCGPDLGPVDHACDGILYVLVLAAIVQGLDPHWDHNPWADASFASSFSSPVFLFPIVPHYNSTTK